MNAPSPTASPLRVLLGSLGALALVAVGIAGILVLFRADEGFPKKSPFAAVRWVESAPEVLLDNHWFRLVSLDNIPVDEIIDFSKRNYDRVWQKRFEEDLVELLTHMGHPPKDVVTLVLQSPTTGETETRVDVPMTEANRSAIRAAAQAREPRAQESESRPQRPTTENSNDTVPYAEVLESIRTSYKLPAMAAFALRDGVIVEQATVGFCTAGGHTPVVDHAQWHLGSNTKAMTATIAGMLVEEGLLSWEATLGDILGEAAPDMDPAHRDTTLTMLLQHRGGIVPNISWFSAPEDRVACAAQILKKPPESKPGDYVYSNAGYVLAGAMMEVVTGKRWELLMQEKLFKPLGMTNTGFGAPSKPGSPWGHDSGLLGWKPMDPTLRGSDNAPVLGPAGTVHSTLEDYARFLAAQLKGAQGVGGIVTAETFATLHTPATGGDYAFGWMVVDRGWAGGRALTHGGSNTLWFATTWLAPEKNMAFFAVTNGGSNAAFKAVDKAVVELIDRHLGL